jgi:hypothetical protein
MANPCLDKCQLAEDAEHIKASLETVEAIVVRLDHGINGVNGSIGLVDRVKTIEGVIRENKPLWSKLRGFNSNAAIIIRTLLIASLMALGSWFGSIIIAGG